MTDLSNKTLSQIVTLHYETAGIFENYGLDFCCRGNKPLIDACSEKQLPVENILEELYRVVAREKKFSDFNDMSLTELAEYIVRVHHSYVKTNLPLLSNYLLRIVSKHGDKYPYMEEVYVLFNELKVEFEKHMQKEEKVLFPKIKLLELTAPEDINALYINGPIQMMEEEHEHAGMIMEKIKKLTSDYSIPEGACTTFQMTLKSLKAFEEDLHRHVHLENNILFPKTLQKYFYKSNRSA